MSAHGTGFVGTGAMGTPMAGRLLARGHRLTVHNRTRARAAELERAGARWAATPAEVAARSGVVLSCLRDTAAVESVYLGPGGLLEAARPGHVFAEHGTFDPALARSLAGAAARHGASFLDIPVTGGAEGASRGELAAMAGGDAAALDRVAGTIGAYCASLTRIGDSGAGLELKLVNQLLVSVHLAAAGEAVSLLERFGLDLGLARDVLTSGWAHSAMLERTLTLVRAGRRTGTGATIAGLAEVQDLVAASLGTAGGFGVFAAARESFARAVREGAGADDPAHLARAAVTGRDRSVPNGHRGGG
ncbi:2-hydroxy-3-oxopropionate reductase [Prauserella shujinwangii]|uniref:2-hydroxy-3-oxopropionate reductase n=1 Tax=Prauserella shujinwangii TaxID=1453103 RepID=A0A2T0LSI4_9PSEU|nr:NAD(P)-dependent oxidoreductase [Prauserella shujinwangii]PRX46618.1 2-hydroxy-3-oxopropionate reductase [Prauserella shujinwangii]